MNGTVMSKEDIDILIEKVQKIAIDKTLSISRPYISNDDLNEVKQQVYKELFAEKIE